MNNILILSPGRQLYIVNQFRKYFEVFIGDNNKTVLGTYNDLQSILLPQYTSQKYWDVLLNFIQRNNIKYVISLSDIEIVILSEGADKISNIGCHFIGLPHDKAIICLDKFLCYEFLSSRGIDTPKTYLDIDQLLYDLDSGKIEFPIIAKQRWGMGSRGLSIINNKFDLKKYYNENNSSYTPTFLSSIKFPEHNIVYQQIIRGQEYGLDIVNDLNSKYVCTCCKEKIEMRNGETDIARICDSTEFESISRTISNNFQHKGNLDCDIISVNGKQYVIDINPRFGGGYLFSTYCGLNVPYLINEWILGHRVIPTLKSSNKIYRKVTSLVEINI